MAGKAIFIGHELNIDSRRMLSEDTMTPAIDQDAELQAHRVINILLHRFGYVDEMSGPGDVQFTIYGLENLGPITSP